MSERGFRYLKCPACKKKGVKFSQRSRGEDGYWCRYCSDFDAFTADDASIIDARGLVMLKETNPDSEVIGSEWALERVKARGEK